LDLVSDQPRPGVDFVLDDGGAFVSGVVSDAMGGPIVGAALSAIGDHPLTSARTDREGHFELSVEPGQVTLHVSADGYAWTYENLRAPDTHAQITLQPAASIAGVVVSGLDQSNLAGVEVRATKRRSGPTTTPGGGSTRSRSDGSFTLSWLSAGTYEITAHAAGWFGGSADDVSLRVADSKSGIRVVVSPAVSVYADVVVAPAGRPCTTGTVSMWRAATAAASAPVGIGEAIRVDGRVVLEAVPPGEYRVDVRCENPRGAREQATLQVANQALHDVHWSVSATASIAGKVVDASGKPVPGRRVFAEPSDPSAREPSGRSAVSGETGLFTLTDLPEARYRVVLAGEDDVSSLVELTAEHPNLVTLVASRSGTIRVLVAADRSDTVAVYAFRGAEQWVAQARANAFEIGGLAEGSYRVVVTDNRNRPLEQDVALRAGDVEQRSVSLPAATGVLRGRLVAADGEPVRDAWVTVSPSGAAPFPRSENTVLSAADGRFELPRLRPDDNYDVNVAQDGEQVARAQGVRIDNELLLNW
jgi:hypothetical protein